VLIDGDSFEEKNAERQNFKKMGNKAQVKAEELRKEFPRLCFDAMPRYLDFENAMFLIRESDIVFLGVDNHATRKIVSDRAIQLENVLIISGGNELTDGNVRIHWRRGGRDITLPLANKFHPEIMEPTDRNPADLGCGEMIESQPQLVIMNNLIAAHMLAAFYAFLQGRIDYDEVYLDLLSGQARTVRRTMKAGR
jgi:hypothetical protein